MRPDLLVAVEAALVAALRTALGSACPVAVYVKQDTTFPFAVLGQITGRVESGFLDDVFLVSAEIGIYTNYRGHKMALDLMNTAYVALHEKPLTLALGRCSECRVTTSRCTLDGDGTTYIGALVLELKIDNPSA